jgi:pimeloyl-ACP methyl ester carboxylesterase
MADRQYRKLARLVIVVITSLVAAQGAARGQQPSLRETPLTAAAPIHNAIVIGFVGGFVSSKDTKHPEVEFAAYLRDRYPSVHVEVFGNHHGRKALHQLINFLDTDHDGILSSLEKEQATVILYGHSWGATETAEFARQLDRLGIPVALTIQVDTIGKPGHKHSAISPNVATAINFYQSGGPLHGQTEIIATDPQRTKILGNIHMTYENLPINCDNYSWYSRTLNKPHHEIENDLRVWDQIASLIDSNLPGVAPATTHASAPSASPFFQYLRRGVQAKDNEPVLGATAIEEDQN